MFKFFKRKKKSENSKETAKDRLKLIIVQDEKDADLDLLESIKDEIIDIISKRLTIDKDKINIKITKENENPILRASIPISVSK